LLSIQHTSETMNAPPYNKIQTNIVNLRCSKTDSSHQVRFAGVKQETINSCHLLPYFRPHISVPQVKGDFNDVFTAVRNTHITRNCSLRLCVQIYLKKFQKFFFFLLCCIIRSVNCNVITINYMLRNILEDFVCEIISKLNTSAPTAFVAALSRFVSTMNVHL